jgi:transposase
LNVFVMLTAMQRRELSTVVNDRAVDAVVASRARMVLWRDEGYSADQVARLAGVSRPTVNTWVRRYAQAGLAGLADRPKPGKPAQVPAAVRARILALTRVSPPAHTGLSHWSSREMARYLRRHEGIDVSHNFVADLWRGNDLQPHRTGTFKVPLSTDTDFEAKVFDVVGMYLNPPDGAIVLSFDEKTQVQALDRTQPLLPIDFARTEKRTHDYVRHGTTNLFAALEVHTGQIHADCFPRRRTVEFLAFMNRLVAAYPAEQPLHVIMDNLSTHSGEDVDKWLAKHSNVTLHYTPTGSSWLNMIETWLGIITRQAIRRGTFSSLPQLIRRITDYVAYWNTDAKPFEWTATPEEIIAKVAILQHDFKKLLANNSK